MSSKSEIMLASVKTRSGVSFSAFGKPIAQSDLLCTLCISNESIEHVVRCRDQVEHLENTSASEGYRLHQRCSRGSPLHQSLWSIMVHIRTYAFAASPTLEQFARNLLIAS